MSADEGPKIIVDEDWKTQVQKEKEQAAASTGDDPAADEPAVSESPASEPGASDPAASDSVASASTGAADAPETDDFPLPPATFPMLVTSLASQAMASLGMMPLPGQDRPVVRLNQCKHCIDMLDMLSEKTKGNLTAEESGMVSDALHQLRMAFVAASSRKS